MANNVIGFICSSGACAQPIRKGMVDGARLRDAIDSNQRNLTRDVEASVGPPLTPAKPAAPAARRAPTRRRTLVGYRTGGAYLRRRLAALIIDSIVLSPVILLCSFVMGGRGPGAWLLYVAAYIVYFFLLELHWGQTPGKLLARLRVVRVDGRPVDAMGIGARSVLRLIDYSPGIPLFGALSMTLTGPRRRRIGDLAGGTIVVEADEYAFVRARRSPLVMVYPLLWLGMALAVGLSLPNPHSGRGPAYAPTRDAGASDLALSQGSVWLTNTDRGTVTRLEERTERQIGRPIPIGGSPVDVAAGGDGVWAAVHADGVVAHVTARGAGVRVSHIRTGAGPFGVAVGFGSVWVANEQDGTVSRIDPKRDKVIGRPLRVGAKPRGIATGGGAVWVADSGDDTVTRIDPRSGRTVRIRLGRYCHDVVAGGGSVWVVSPPNAIVRIDPATNRVSGAPLAVGAGPTSAEMQGRFVWVANADDGTVAQVDSKKRAIVGRPISVGGTLSDLGVGAGQVWALRTSDGRALRVR